MGTDVKRPALNQSLNTVLNTVITVIESTLKIPANKLDVDASFDSFGIDSIIAMELMESLSKKLSITLTPAQFLQVDSIRALAQFIEQTFDVGHQSTAASDPVAISPLGSDPTQVSGFDRQLDYIKQQYAIDLTAQQWRSEDQIVDELLVNHLDQVLGRFSITAETEELATPTTVAPARQGQILDVAVIGLSCRFPDAPNALTFWQNLLDRKNSIKEIPASRWDWTKYYATTATAGKTLSKWGALLEQIDQFDAPFFNMTFDDARLIDPQERLLMEEVYRAIQDAGIDISGLAGSSTGVFIGYEYAEYEHYIRQHIDQIPGLVCSSSSPTYYLANRLSYTFDFCGPSETVNVNCASSAVAMHRACYALHNQEADLAIAGGVCLHLFAGDYITASQYGLLSDQGNCAVFDDKANGFTRAEGVGVVILKPLAAAQRDHDRIYAVIKASHQNNRGRANALSEVKYQAITAVMADCYRKADLDPASIRYIEINGYAKKWADSFEFEGIKQAFSGVTDGGKSCALGSLKGNIGHLEPVNGVASVIKVAMALHQQKFPASISKQTTNSFIDLADPSHPLYFADQELTAASLRQGPNIPIRAAVSSFADSGVNIHMVLEEYRQSPAATAAEITTAEQLLVLSAKDPARLLCMVDQFIDFIANDPDPASFSALIYTLQMGREAMAHKVAIIANDYTSLAQKLALLRQSGFEQPLNLEKQGIYYADSVQAARHGLVTLFTSELTVTQLQLSIQTAQWQQIAQLWIHGVAIPWSMIWAGKAQQPMSLPGYPFAPTRCWVDFVGVDSPQPTITAAPVERPVDRPIIVAANNAPALGQWHFSMLAPDAPAQGVTMPALDKIQLYLRQAIGQQLDVALEQVALDVDLVSLGLDSMAIAAVISQANELLQIHLSPSVVFKHPQIDSLSQYLVERHLRKVTDLVVTQVVELSSVERDILIPIQAKGSRAPIFAIPGADGGTLSFQLLSKALGDDQPFYGLESLGLDGITAPLTSIEAIAALNIAVLRTVQPQGPYRLLGYSNGGVVAFEMAHQLLAANETIETLWLLDSLCPTLRTNTATDLIVEVFAHLISTLGGEVELDVDELAQIPEAQRCDYLYDVIAKGNFDLSKAFFSATYQVATLSEQLCRAYQFEPLPTAVDVVLFRAIHGYTDVPEDYGWAPFLLKPIQRYDIDASHYTVVFEQPATDIALKITVLAHRLGQE